MWHCFPRSPPTVTNWSCSNKCTMKQNRFVNDSLTCFTIQLYINSTHFPLTSLLVYQQHQMHVCIKDDVIALIPHPLESQPTPWAPLSRLCVDLQSPQWSSLVNTDCSDSDDMILLQTNRGGCDPIKDQPTLENRSLNALKGRWNNQILVFITP